MLYLLIAIANAAPIPCVYNYFYNDGERTTYCVIKTVLYDYKTNGDFVNDKMVKMDCGNGIVNNGKKINKDHPRFIVTVKSRCLEPGNKLEEQLINNLYKGVK